LLKIYQDEIDILIELATLDMTCEIMALKPAPFRSLGWVGMPGFQPADYFIADPYVLPESAQEYTKKNLAVAPNLYSR